MSISRGVILTVLLGALGAACTPRSEDQPTKTADAGYKAAEEAKEAGREAVDDTKNVAEEIVKKIRGE